MSNPQILAIQKYLNDVPPQIFQSAVDQNYDAARAAVMKMDRAAIREDNYFFLWKVKESPKPEFYSTPDDPLSRIATDSCWLRLNPVARHALAPDWHDVDFSQTQLAICATLWQVKSVLAFIKSGASLWRELGDQTGVKSPSLYNHLKRTLYSVCFGMSLEGAKNALNHRLVDQPIFDAGQKFVEHDLIRELHEASQQQCALVEKNDGLPDSSGNFQSLSGRKSSRMLALVSQDWERKLLYPIFQLAAETDEFLISLYQYDGVSVLFQKNEEQNRQRILDVLNQSANDCSIPTYARWKF